MSFDHTKQYLQLRFHSKDTLSLLGHLDISSGMPSAYKMCLTYSTVKQSFINSKGSYLNKKYMQLCERNNTRKPKGPYEKHISLSCVHLGQHLWLPLQSLLLLLV